MALPLRGWAGPIHEAIEARDPEAVKRILAADKSIVNSRTAGGSTPLHMAVGLNHVELVELLLVSGAEVNAVTPEGYTPLHWAAYMNAGDSAGILLRHGADLHAKTRDGYSALQVAVNEKSEIVARLLLSSTRAVYTDKFLDTRFTDAESARKAGDLEKAYELLTELLREDPGNEKINFALGLTCMSLKDASRAVMAFSRVLEINPNNNRARVELGRACLMQNDPVQARRHFQAALARNPPADVRKTIEDGIRMIDSRAQRWIFSGRLEVGYFDDSNVNVGPDSETISISPISYGSQIFNSLQLGLDSQPSESKGAHMALALTAQYDGGRPGQWMVASDAFYYQNSIERSNRYETAFAQFTCGPRYFSKSYAVQVPARVAHVISGGDALMTSVGIAPSHIFRTGPEQKFQWTTSWVAEYRDYTKLDARDGVYLSIGETLRQSFGTARHSLLLGVALNQDRTDAAIYDYRGFEWNFGCRFNLPHRTTAYASLRYAQNSYAEKEVLALEKRVDTQNRVTLGISKMLTTWWGLDVNYQRTDNSSTFGLYQYDRNVAMITTYFAF